MPSRIISFFHYSQNNTDMASVGTAFDKTKAHAHDLRSGAAAMISPSEFYGRIEGVQLRCSAIAGGATKLTFRLTLDSDGDRAIIPDTEATIATGVTTATDGYVTFSVKLPFFQTMGVGGALPRGTLYVMVKTDAGTVTLKESIITWSET